MGLLQAFLPFLSLQVPSLRVASRVALPHGALAFALLVVALFGISLAVGSLDRRLTMPGRFPAGILVILLLVGVTVFAIVAYPAVGGARTPGRGSDADDALQVTGESFLRGASPYRARTYLGHRPSPGPGWMILWLPWTLLGATGLGNVFWVGAAAATLRLHARSWGPPLCFLVLLVSAPVFWEMLATGGDTLAIGCAAVAGLNLLFAARSEPEMAGTAVLIGMLATSRVVFLFLGPLAGWLLWRACGRRRDALLYGGVSTSVTIALHLAFFAWDPASYSPVHLLEKGRVLLAGPMFWVFAIACAVTAVFVVRRAATTQTQRLFSLWIGLAVPLAVIAWVDLQAARGYSLPQWQGANYLVPQAAAFAASRALSWSR